MLTSTNSCSVICLLELLTAVLMLITNLGALISSTLCTQLATFHVLSQILCVNYNFISKLSMNTFWDLGLQGDSDKYIKRMELTFYGISFNVIAEVTLYWKVFEVSLQFIRYLSPSL